MFLFISGAEIFITIFIIVLLFGTKKIPELARGLGQALKYLRQTTDDIKEEITKTTDTSLGKDLKEIKGQIDEVTESVKRESKKL